MSDWLVDDQGDVRRVCDPQLGEAWESLRCPEEFARYAVMNLGFARVATGTSGIRVSWRPTFTGQSTLAGMILWLRSQRAVRVLVSSLRDDWKMRICPSPTAAARLILEEFQTAECDREGFFQSRRRDLPSLPLGDNLGSLLKALSEKGFSCGIVELWDMLDLHADRRFILTEQEGDKGPLRVLTWGSGYHRFKASLISRMQGKSFENQPDKAYARWAAEGYKRVQSTREAVIEDVDASTWCPGQGRRRVRYTRLLAPLHIKDRGLFVLSTAKLIGSI